MHTVHIPINTPGGAPLSCSPRFLDLADYVNSKLVHARIITEWDRAVHLAGNAIVIETPSELPEALTEWAVDATREFYAPLTLGAIVRESQGEDGAKQGRAAPPVSSRVAV